jgi:hypothetical protein
MAKSKQQNITNITLPMMRGGVRVIYLPPNEEARNLIPGLNSDTVGQTFDYGGYINPDIWINAESKENKVAVLAHEALHAISFICEARGVGYDEELFAYAIQYIVEQSISKIPSLS